jgi:hypothetical protein
MPISQIIPVDKFERKHYIYIIIFGIIILFIGYLFYYFRNYSQLGKIKNITASIPEQSELESYDADQCLMKYKNNYLSDFYVASSANSFLVGNQKYDYTSIDMIKNCIIMGARYIELEVVGSSIDINSKPVITTGIDNGQWQTSLDNIDFELACETIAGFAFDPAVKTYQLPFFLYIKLRIDNNPNLLSKMGIILNKYFPLKETKDLALGNRVPKKINPARTKICSLFNQIVIWSDPVKTTEYDKIQLELANGYLNVVNKFPPQRLHYTDVSTAGKLNDTDAKTPIQRRKKMDDLTELNKNQLTIVYPNKDDDSISSSYDSEEGWSYGCHFVAINYQLNDPNRTIYFNKFMKDSIVLKPAPLRNDIDKMRVVSIDNLIPNEVVDDDIIKKQFAFFYKDIPIYIRPFNNSSKVLTITEIDGVKKLVVKTKTDEELDIIDAFLVKPYLSNKNDPVKVSLESVYYPNFYLTYGDNEFILEDWRTRKFDDDVKEFIINSSFIIKQGLISTRGKIGSEDKSNIITPCIQANIKTLMVYNETSDSILPKEDDYDYTTATQATFNIYKLPVRRMYTIRQTDNQFVMNENSLLKKTNNIPGIFDFQSETEATNFVGIKDLSNRFIHIKDNKNNYWTVDKSLLRANEKKPSEKTRFYLQETGKFTQIFYNKTNLPVISQSDGVLRIAYQNEINKKETNFIIGTSFAKIKL